MGVTFKFICSGCGAAGSTETDEDMGILNVRGNINITSPCPACGHKLSLPPGKYVRDDSNVMVRVGDYEVTSKPDPEGNTLVRFECECGAALTTSMGVKMANLNIGGQLQVGNKPCPLCSRPLALPSGHYKTDESGMLVRVGDFQAGVTSADDLNKKLN